MRPSHSFPFTPSSQRHYGNIHPLHASATLLTASTFDHEYTSALTSNSLHSSSTSHQPNNHQQQQQHQRTYTDFPRGLGFTPNAFHQTYHIEDETRGGGADGVRNEEEDDDDDDDDEEEVEEEQAEEESYQDVSISPPAQRNSASLHPSSLQSAQSYNASSRNPHAPLLGSSAPHSSSASPSLTSYTFSPYTPSTRRRQRKLLLGVSTSSLLSPSAMRGGGGRYSLGKKYYFGLTWLTRSRIGIACLLLPLALLHSSELLLRKSISATLFPYRWFLFQIIALFTFALCAYQAYNNRKNIKYYLKHHGLPYGFFSVISFLDTIAALGLTMAIGTLPLEWGIILSQLTIPISLLFRFFSTNGLRGCGRNAFLGTIMMLIGVSVTVGTQFLQYQSACTSMDAKTAEMMQASAGSSDNAAGGSATTTTTTVTDDSLILTNTPNTDDTRSILLFHTLLLLFSLLSSSVSSISKERYLRQHTMNTVLMNFCSAAGSVLWGFVLAPLAIGVQALGGNVESNIEVGGTDQLDGDGSTGIGGIQSSTTTSQYDSLSQFSLERPLNVFRNFMAGTVCLFGKEGQEGDGCEVGGERDEIRRKVLVLLILTHFTLSAFLTQDLSPYLTFEFLLFLCILTGLPNLLQHTLHRIKQRDSYLIDISLSLGVAIAYALAEMEWMSDMLLPEVDTGRCLVAGSMIGMMGVTLVVVGEVAAQYEPSSYSSKSSSTSSSPPSSSSSRDLHHHHQQVTNPDLDILARIDEWSASEMIQLEEAQKRRQRTSKTQSVNATARMQR